MKDSTREWVVFAALSVLTLALSVWYAARCERRGGAVVWTAVPQCLDRGLFR